MLSRIKILVLVMVAYSFSCTIGNQKNKIVPPDLDEFISEVFDSTLIDELNIALNNYIDTSLKYSLEETYYIQRSDDWKILEPILINSSYNRSLSIVAKRHIGEDDAGVDISWLCGFRYLDQWYFFGNGEYLPLQLDIPENKLMTYDEIQNWAEKKEMQGYLIYDKHSKEWTINDHYFKRYMDNINYAPIIEQVGYREFYDGPYEYWSQRYMYFVQMSRRLIELTKIEWKRQDELFTLGKLTQQEYDDLLSLRNPKTSEQWKNREEFYNVNRKDSILNQLYKDLRGEIPPKKKNISTN